MEKELLDYVAERVGVLSVSGASKQDTKDMALAWKEAVAADPGAAEAETDKLLDFLEGRLVGIDDLIAFIEGPGTAIFGEQGAANMLAAQLERKARGEKYCNCEAHLAAVELLSKFGRLEL